MGNCLNPIFRAGNDRISHNTNDPLRTTSRLGLFSAPSTSTTFMTPSSLTVPSYSQVSASDCIPTPRTEGEILSSPNLKAFTFKELERATRNFSYFVGQGGFGRVYKGWIDEQTLTPSKPRLGMVVAVKRLRPEDTQGHKEWLVCSLTTQGHKEWLTEINYLGQLQHPNVVKLLGFCSEEGNWMLVYEFMLNGSLENHLFQSAQPLPWATRIKIARGAAKGLSFLHDSENQIILRDIKASNILLDLDFNAKLSDFGLAIDGPIEDMAHVSTRVVGTHGYAAPEYVATDPLRTTSRLGLFPALSTSTTFMTPSSLTVPSYSQVSTSDCIPTPRTEGEILLSPNLKAFTFKELKRATRNFSYVVGQGGFGHVYKGWIDEQTLTPSKPRLGMAVAVKRLRPEGTQGHKEWLTEINYLGQLQHPNVVKLFGFCSEEDNRMLVYEFMLSGSLENHLFQSAQPLPWATRIKIARGAAKGLSFLHDGEIQIIYRDVKVSNILLDLDFNAKLSDFGLAIDGPIEDMTHVSTRVVGTHGYAAPEYVATGRLSAKADVYSFGVLFLEILSGRRAYDMTKSVLEQNLLEWAKSCPSDKPLCIIDSTLGGQYPNAAACAAVNIALQCTVKEPKCRPRMSEVLATLEDI